jgi:periplasmic protein TonB
MVMTFSVEHRLPQAGLLLTICLAHALVLGWLGRMAPVSAPPRPVIAPRVVGRLVAAPSAVAHSVATPRPNPIVARSARPRAIPLKPNRVQPTHASVAPVSAPAASMSDAPPARSVPAAGPRKEEGQLQLPVSRASGLDNPLPIYPALSRRLREEGVVRLSVMILADGRVAEVSVQKSSGFPRLDAAAVAAVRRWHYLPARRDGVAIVWQHVQPVAFSLND